MHLPGQSLVGSHPKGKLCQRRGAHAAPTLFLVGVGAYSKKLARVRLHYRRPTTVCSTPPALRRLGKWPVYVLVVQAFFSPSSSLLLLSSLSSLHNLTALAWPRCLPVTGMSANPPGCAPNFGCSISNKWLDEFVSLKTKEFATKAPVSPDSGCLLNDAGDFLVRTSAALAHLADGVANGRHIDVYIEKRVNEMDQQHEFSDLSKLDSLEDKNSLLK